MSASPVSAHQQQQIIQSAGGEDLSMYRTFAKWLTKNKNPLYFTKSRKEKHIYIERALFSKYNTTTRNAK